MSSGNGTGNTGQVIAIKGAVVDVGFQPDHLPEIYDALEIERPNQGRLVLEVQQHLGEDACAPSRWTRLTVCVAA